MKGLPPEAFVVGNKIYCKCDDCNKLVQLNKTFFGSLHICLTDEEICAKNKRKCDNRLKNSYKE